jgi:hypothetical protein
MAMIVRGHSRCHLCDQIMEKDEPLTGFPAILERAHALYHFSDSIMHKACLDAHPDAARMRGLYARWRRVVDRRPRGLRSPEEIDAWAREAFGKLYAEDGFRTSPG